MEKNKRIKNKIENKRNKSTHAQTNEELKNASSVYADMGIYQRLVPSWIPFCGKETLMIMSNMREEQNNNPDFRPIMLGPYRWKYRGKSGGLTHIDNGPSLISRAQSGEGQKATDI